MHVLTYKTVHALLTAVALLATVVFAWDHVARRRGWGHERARLATFALVGVLSLLGWWNFGRLHYGRYIHVHEFFHYYLGAKYHTELGYTRLYTCVVAADVDAGLVNQVSRRWVRDLSTNTLETGLAVAARRDECVTHFTPGRWQAFTRDVAWLRSQVDDKKWSTLLTDHGFNATPVWTMGGASLANLAPATDRAMVALALIDPLLIATMWALACWAFGWQAATVAAAWWGTNLAGRFSWTGGAFLRADWLLATTAALCFARRNKPFLGGFTLGWATLLRVFPGYVAAALLLREVGWWIRARRVAPSAEFLRFVAGGAMAVVLLVPLSSYTLAGRVLDIDGWRGFVENSRKHLATPLTNHVGLKPIFAFEARSRAALSRELWLDSPWDAWKAARQRVFERRRVAYWLTVAAFVALLGRAVAGTEPWEALALGLGLIPIAAELTSYYYSVLLGLGFLWLRRTWTGVGLAVASLATGLMAFAPIDDDRFLGVSVAVVVYVLAVTADWALRSTRDSQALSPGRQEPAANTPGSA